MAELKTILFTDIVRSVDLKSEMPGHSDSERDLAFIEQILTPHRQRIEQQLTGLGGRVVSTAGDGHFLVFSDTISAARWAIDIQRSHRESPILAPSGSRVEVRISLHLGAPQLDPGDPNNFIGKQVDYAARLNDYATGEQILVSRSVVAVLEDAGMDGVKFHNHGRRELKGIGRVEVFELIYDGGPARKMRPQPRESFDRQWTVLPPTMGLTTFRAPPFREPLGGRAVAVAAGATPGGSSHQGGPGAVRPQPPATDVIPLRLGNYELEQRLGSGGMGDVYRARHSQFNRVRAVKVIKQHFVDAGHHEVIRRFYQEIKAVGALEHPNIVVAIDSSAPTDEVHYLVMEYIEGLATDELVTRHGPLAVADACEIVRQAARGLAYIHEHGMVHRDIKPSNIMLTLTRTEPVGSGVGSTGSTAKAQSTTVETAVVKILDLGLALLVGEDQQRLTVFDNRAMGTAMYMSPEQWKSSSVDIRADIYSLGCTLYHLLAGKPPFLESDLKPEKAHEREQLPAIDRGEPIPRALWDVLRRMTAKNPIDRYADPAEVVAALAPFAEGHKLADLVRSAGGTSPHDRTRGMAKTETLVAKSAFSDTQTRTAPSWRVHPALSGISREKLSRAAIALITLGAVLAIGWLVWQASARSKSAAEELKARQHTLQISAKFAASEISKEIGRRFDILNQLASDVELRQQLTAINDKPEDTAQWKHIENWLGARKADNNAKAASDSWFINDSHGVQIARSPKSDTSGENFAHRDYFHGQGADLPPETKDIKPISAPHLSAVYRSTSTGHLKVAFSVPIENGRKGKERQVIGVLAMAVDLGEFNVLQKDLPDGLEVVLVDLRTTTIDKETRPGLILHHQRDEAAYREGQSPPWVSSQTLGQINEVLTKPGPAKSEASGMLTEYRDEALTGGKPYWGAIERVAGRSVEEPAQKIDWVVLVQEPLSH